jgi:hypothetical protein
VPEAAPLPSLSLIVEQVATERETMNSTPKASTPRQVSFSASPACW